MLVGYPKANGPETFLNTALVHGKDGPIGNIRKNRITILRTYEIPTSGGIQGHRPPIDNTPHMFRPMVSEAA